MGQCFIRVVNLGVLAKTSLELLRGTLFLVDWMVFTSPNCICTTNSFSMIAVSGNLKELLTLGHRLAYISTHLIKIAHQHKHTWMTNVNDVSHTVQ